MSVPDEFELVFLSEWYFFRPLGINILCLYSTSFVAFESGAFNAVLIDDRIQSSDVYVNPSVDNVLNDWCCVLVDSELEVVCMGEVIHRLKVSDDSIASEIAQRKGFVLSLNAPSLLELGDPVIGGFVSLRAANVHECSKQEGFFGRLWCSFKNRFGFA